MKLKQTTILFLALALAFSGSAALAPASNFARADSLQNQIDYDNSQIQQLNQQIAQYQAQLRQLGSDKRTLQAAIRALDLRRSQIEAQIAMTQSQINSTQTQIQQLSGQISATDKKISQDKADLAQYIREIQANDSRPAIMQMLAAGSFSQFWQSVDQTNTVLDAVKGKVRDLQAAQENLQNAKNTQVQKSDQLSAQQQTLASQQQSLNVTEHSKSRLLSETNSQESRYQKLLAQAKAELESFSNFARNAGGANLLPHETSCDAWGCYYNQRDMAWGADPLNGTQYNLASDGCLITDMAMVMTHYGYRDVTPATINSNPDNFASYYPAYLLYTITADGVTATRVQSEINAELATGNPVVVGMRVYGGTHFVVLVSGSNGNYIMRDPYIANGKDINFFDHYNLREIYSITRVVVGK